MAQWLPAVVALPEAWVQFAAPIKWLTAILNSS